MAKHLQQHDYISADSDIEDEQFACEDLHKDNNDTIPTVKTSIDDNNSLILNSSAKNEEEEQKDSEWQKPISLKMLKKHLNELFVLK